MKYYGKEKCRILKQIRAEIARQNDIAWVVEECSHKGNCRGTCPRCEAEVRALERALERRQAMGKAIAVVGISAGLSLAVTGCDIIANQTDGDMKPETSVMTTEQTTEHTTEHTTEQTTESVSSEDSTQIVENSETTETTFELAVDGEPAEYPWDNESPTAGDVPLDSYVDGQ